MGQGWTQMDADKTTSGFSGVHRWPNVPGGSGAQCDQAPRPLGRRTLQAELHRLWWPVGQGAGCRQAILWDKLQLVQASGARSLWPFVPWCTPFGHGSETQVLPLNREQRKRLAPYCFAGSPVMNTFSSGCTSLRRSRISRSCSSGLPSRRLMCSLMRSIFCASMAFFFCIS